MTGARVVYLFLKARERIYLLTVFAKNVKETLTEADKKEFRALVQAIKGGP